MDGFFYQVSFWVLAVITVGSALLVATQRNLTRAVVFMVFFFLGAAGLYFLLQAEFLALVQVMVYAGAVAVIFAFVVMLTPGLPGTGFQQTLNRGFGLVISALFVVMMFLAFGDAPGMGILPAATAGPTTAELGKLLLRDYLLPFEMVSLILMVALVGAVVYTYRGSERGEGRRGTD
ncbi:MAG: NADH-quinone oxidoreductase subunit J family protein [Bacillota bacterium]